MPSRIWPARPATRTMKNSSRLAAEIDRKRTRSSSGCEGFCDSSSTRRLNCSQENSRLTKRSGLPSEPASGVAVSVTNHLRSGLSSVMRLNIPCRSPAACQTLSPDRQLRQIDFTHLAKAAHMLQTRSRSDGWTEFDMAGGSVPHFQNDAGHPAIDIGVKEFM